MKKKIADTQKEAQKLARETLEDLAKKGMAAPKDLWRRAVGPDIDILSPDEFYEKLNKPVESKASQFLKQMREGGDNCPRINPGSKVIVINPTNNKWKWVKVKNAEEFKKLISASRGADKKLEKMRKARLEQYFRKLGKSKKAREDNFGGFGFGDDSANIAPNAQAGYEVKHEYTPLLSTPFFKQMYLYDYLLMHSKCFWYKNYNGPAKLLLGIIRNFVIGNGFSVTCDDKKASEAWEDYEDRSSIHERLPVWCDELSMSGEHFLEKKFVPGGISHTSIDPSTIWEIITDPENIEDVKYYHQQYPTQYQLYGTKDAPISEYIIRQLPPELIHHTKINVTSWEKRGRSDLLAGLLYMKYFDDYIGFKLQRTKAEAAYFWDVVVKGDLNAVNAYINQTQSTVDVPPGSENVHNEAIERKPITPSLSHSGSDDVAKWILSYVFMSLGIPTSYAGTLESTGASRASALVSTEPVVKLMEERRRKVEGVLQLIWEDVMIDAGLDPYTEVEFNFDELVVEDRSKKIEDTIVAHKQKVFSHETMSNIIAKEMNHTSYNYAAEQKKIQTELTKDPTLLDPEAAFDAEVQAAAGGSGDTKGGQDLTSPEDESEIKASRSLDRNKVRDQNTQL